MKKLLFLVSIVTLFFITGCGEQGKYKEGTYFGYDTTSKYTSVVYVDNSGLIKSIFIDAPYVKAADCTISKDSTGKDTAKCNPSTKQILGDSYGMSRVTTVGEWYVQVGKFADEVIKEQDVDWVVLKYKDADEKITATMPSGQTEKDKVYIDSVAGVTLDASSPYNAVKSALDKAKK